METRKTDVLAANTEETVSPTKTDSDTCFLSFFLSFHSSTFNGQSITTINGS